MTKGDVLSVAFKILGVVAVMYTIISLPSIVLTVSTFFQHPSSQMLKDMNPFWYLGVAIGFPILMSIMAYILLRWGDLIAKKLIRVDSTLPVLGTSHWEKPIFALSLRIVGVVCLIKGIPDIVYALVKLAFRGQYTIRFYLEAPILIRGVVLLIIAAYLISGGRHLVKFAFRKRTTAPSSDKEVRGDER